MMNAYVQVLRDAFKELGLLDDKLKHELEAGELPHMGILTRHFAFLKKGGAPSKNCGDFDHFCLVVRKMTELIKEPAKVLKLANKQLAGGEQGEVGMYEELLKGLERKLNCEDGGPRKKFLLWAAFYHDIGKAIERARHGAEGADIIKDSHAADRELFWKVGISRPEIFRLACLVRFHDYFGTLATGEASYLLFMEVFFPPTNPFLYHEPLAAALQPEAPGAGGAWPQDELFFDDLFLLNVADIAASVDQLTWEKAIVLMHDYAQLRPRVELSREKVCCLDEMTARLHEDSVTHTAERIRRLLREGVQAGVEPDPEGSDELTRREARDHFFELEDIQPVIRTLTGLNLPASFYDAFALTAKLDYGLPFVKMLVKKFVDNMHNRFCRAVKAGKGNLTTLDDVQHDYRHDMASTLVRLLVTILGNYGPLTERRTRIYLEFKDLNDRAKTTPPTLLSRMTGVDGNFKQQEAFKKALDSVFIWKANP
jgi:hypothetical protein